MPWVAQDLNLKNTRKSTQDAGHKKYVFVQIIQNRGAG
jgi:hypothetical protein